MTLSYLNDPGTFPSIEQIPLEYFEKAIAWMQHSDKMRQDGIAIFGASKGAEAALLLGSRDPAIKAVIAMSPSNVVWQGLPKVYWPTPPALSS